MLKAKPKDCILDFEKRADRLGLKAGQLHLVAEVHHSTWQRWRRGDTEPQHYILLRLDEYLTRVEKATPGWAA